MLKHLLYMMSSNPYDDLPKKIHVEGYGAKTTQFWFQHCICCRETDFKMWEVEYQGKALPFFNHHCTMYMCEKCAKKYRIKKYKSKAYVPFNFYR